MRVVVALGGNAFVRPGGTVTMAGQFEFARRALTHLLPILAPDNEVLISHGNGPQVGHILIRVEQALGEAYALPLEVCVAESEGELGYVLQQTLHNLLVKQGAPRDVVSVLTQVVVNGEDPAFSDPTKPIGPFLDRERAEVLRSEGLAIREDAGRGYRRVVPSPAPVEIVERAVLEHLLAHGAVVIAAGGGGIPVIRRDRELAGVEAVVDKDRAAALLADQLSAELLVVVTGVPCVYRDFGAPTQAPIRRMSVGEATRLLEAGALPVGSMGPKVEAAARFCVRPGRRAIICDPESLSAALSGRGGTTVVPDSKLKRDER